MLIKEIIFNTIREILLSHGIVEEYFVCEVATDFWDEVLERKTPISCIDEHFNEFCLSLNCKLEDIIVGGNTYA